MVYWRLQAAPDYSYYAYCVLCMETQIEDSRGITAEMGKRLLKKPDATVDSVLKVRSNILNGIIHAASFVDTNCFVITTNRTFNALFGSLAYESRPRFLESWWGLPFTRNLSRRHYKRHKRWLVSVQKESCHSFRSPLMKTPDMSVETLRVKSQPFRLHSF